MMHRVRAICRKQQLQVKQLEAFRSLSSGEKDPSVYFGYQKVPEADKKGMVTEVFSSVADSYDVMNDLMSAGIHRIWKDKFVRLLHLDALSISESTTPRILDVAGGTGDIAFRILDCISPRFCHKLKSPVMTISDINPNMLQVGKSRAAKRYDRRILDLVEFAQADAEKLPFDSNAFDLYTISFGLRNVSNIPLALEEAFRVLKPGGRFMCLEFSHVSNPVVKNLYDAFSFGVIPKIGELVAKDRPAYQYLVESIRMFPTQVELEKRLSAAGFRNVTHLDMTFGIVSVHSGFKL